MNLNAHTETPELDLSSALFCEMLRREQRSEEIARTALHLGSFAMRFARVERVPRYDETSRENDAEHSFMLSLVATEIAAQYFPDLDIGAVAQYATVHDLIELETGDVATFDLSDSDLATKTASEHAALDRLCDKLPRHTAAMLRCYEAQAEPEARFVRLIDKLLPVVVDIVGPGRKVMEEDYDVHDSEQLSDAEAKLRQRFADMFPEPEFSILLAARADLADMFASCFAAA